MSENLDIRLISERLTNTETVCDRCDNPILESEKRYARDYYVDVMDPNDDEMEIINQTVKPMILCDSCLNLPLYNSAEWVKELDGEKCPVCNHWDIHGDGVPDIDGPTCYAKESCPSCGSSWVVAYDLNRYINLEIPTPDKNLMPYTVLLQTTTPPMRTYLTVAHGSLYRPEGVFEAEIQARNQCVEDLGLDDDSNLIVLLTLTGVHKNLHTA